MVAQYTVPVGKAANEHETAPRRNYQCREKPLVRPPNTKCSTVYEFVLECFQKNKNSNAMGWRDVKEIHEESKSVMKKLMARRLQWKRNGCIMNYRIIIIIHLTN